MNVWDSLAFGLMVIFGGILAVTLCRNFEIFFKSRVGRQHAFLGFCYLMWIFTGYLDSIFLIFMKFGNTTFSYLIYDVFLGVLGTMLTLTAAHEFQHKNIRNIASGTLDQHATVTHNEMIEHSFYQILNLVQVVYLHCIFMSQSLVYRFLGVVLVAMPWYFRTKYPVHSFSDNYNKIDDKSTTFVRIMYRIKKYQYVFYKHFLLHGLNISVALSNSTPLATASYFRTYWVLLNTAYTMEFFLQTLVKKNHMSQRVMLGMQWLLMTASTVAAVKVLQKVKLAVAGLSLALNFLHRGHDLANTVTVMLIALVCIHFQFMPYLWS